MDYTILVPTSITAENVKSHNRSAVCVDDIPNGTPLVCDGLSTSSKQQHVFKVTKPTALAKSLWMSYSPENVYTRDGRAEFSNIQADIREFYIKAGEIIDIFKPVSDVDLIQVTTPFFATGFDPKTVVGATYVEISATGTMQAVVTPTTDFEGLQFRILRSEPYIIGSGQLGGEGIDAWILQCTNN